MTTFGVTPTGFRRKTADDIKKEFEADELSDIGADFDVSTESVPGQMNGIVARQLGMGWEQLEVCYNGGDPDASEGRMLEMLCKLTGTFRKGSTASEVTLACLLDDTTVLVAGTHFAAIEDKGDIRWTPKADYTTVGTGLKQVVFVSELLGPTEGLAGTINVIATPVVGWHTVVNALDAELGTEIDLDPLLRARRERELATIGSATVRAITANVSQAFFSKLENLTVFENDTDSPDANGMPPHSIEVLIFDGQVPSIDDDALAQVIYDSKAGAIQTFGIVLAHANALVSGIETTKEVRFTRATQVPIYLELDLKKAPSGYPGDGAMKELIAKAASARFGPARSVAESAIEAFAFASAGVEKVSAVRLGLAPSPVGTIDIPISFRQIARFDTSRIVINAT